MRIISILGLLMVAGAMALNTNSVNADAYRVLPDKTFAPAVASFNASYDESVKTAISNQQALAWLSQNIPRFDSPDAQLNQAYWFRWWVYRKHLKKTADGWIVTEFLPDVPWAGTENSISAAAGHHLYEGRWLRDPQYADDYARFWFHDGAEPRRYSFWAADS